MKGGARWAKVPPVMSESNAPPRVPDKVVDEAGDSPPWLPWIGFALVGLLALFLVGRQAMESAREAAKPAADEAAEPAEAPPPAE